MLKFVVRKQLIYMRKKIIPLLIMASLIIFTACQKQIELDASNTNGFIDPGVGNFQAKIEGVQWSANEVTTASIQNSVISIYGSNTDGKSIFLRVGDSGVHNYSFTNNSLSNVASLTDSSLTPIAAFTTNQWSVDSTYGNLDITSIDTVTKTISGTFNIHVYRQIDDIQRNITEGVFTNISYATQPVAPAATDTFRVKIDGTDFTYNLLSGNTSFNMILITASQGGTKSVGITMPSNVTPGSYNYGGTTYVGSYNPDASTFLGAETGNLTILEHNTTTKRIRGTFNFHANTVFSHLPPNAELTEGYFSVVYN